jgi:hypothetical protein
VCQHCTTPYGNTADEWDIGMDWKEVVVVDGSIATAFVLHNITNSVPNSFFSLVAHLTENITTMAT